MSDSKNKILSYSRHHGTWSGGVAALVKDVDLRGKGKVHPRTGHEGPEGEWTYSSTLSLMLVLERGGWSMPCPGCFTPRE
jgi:hypothetical protein